MSKLTDSIPADELCNQVKAQCRAIVHMANALAEVYAARERLADTAVNLVGAPEALVMMGQDSHAAMDWLGEHLNGLDAVDEDKDGWMDPVFARAQQWFPLPVTQKDITP